MVRFVRLLALQAVSARFPEEPHATVYPVGRDHDACATIEAISQLLVQHPV